ncbi:hypothetical protein MNBD_DELTA03-486 [hydrothermal vent metagenome]|uniref:Uncharacterized protein n=1 Tax=hydrothermal vent metagenome TaxID=652676 RepID=A0A3B0VUL8_9ZZZZ
MPSKELDEIKRYIAGFNPAEFSSVADIDIALSAQDRLARAARIKKRIKMKRKLARSFKTVILNVDENCPVMITQEQIDELLEKFSE